MGALISSWKMLSDRQKVALSATGGWAGAWLIGHILDAAVGIAWGPFRAVLDFANSYVLNGYVGAFLFGALIIGFLPNIISIVKHPTAWLIIPVIVGLTVGIGGSEAVFMLAKSRDPKSFALRQDEIINHPLSSRNIQDIDEIIFYNTTLKSDEILRNDFNRWVSVQGYLRQAQFDEDGNLHVLLHKYDDQINLLFAKNWSVVIGKMNVRDRIFALCKISYVRSFSITLTNCALLPPR